MRRGELRPAGRRLLFAPLVIAAIGLPLALGIVPPNGLYGIRTAATLASEAGWYHANFWVGFAAVVLGIPATAANFAVARSPTLTITQKHLLPLAILLVVAAATAFAGLAAF